MSAIHETGWPANKPSIEVRFRAEFVATKRDDLIEQLAESLREEGYFVALAQGWEKTAAFRKRSNLSHDALHRILTHPFCPPVVVDRGNNGTGRVRGISSNPLFEAFCQSNRGETPKRTKQPRPSRAKPDHLLQRNRKGEGRKIKPASIL